jgi:hypothetical protein
MRFSRRPLRASVVHVIAAFAPIAACSDLLDLSEQDTQHNPPRCATPQSVGCIAPPEWEDAGEETAAPDATLPDAAIVDASPRDASATATDATAALDAVAPDTECPALPPIGGGACARPESQSCSYGPFCGSFPTRSANCRNGGWVMSQTSCNPPPPQCPEAAPTEGAGCDPGRGPNRCDYGRCDGGTAEVFECSLATDGGAPTGASWHLVQRCGLPVCPSGRPVHNTACDLPTGSRCNYGLCEGQPVTVAHCMSGLWSVAHGSCNPPPLCPGLAPAEGSLCFQLPGQACTFSLSAGGTVIGTCVGGKWQLGVADAGT